MDALWDEWRSLWVAFCYPFSRQRRGLSFCTHFTTVKWISTDTSCALLVKRSKCTPTTQTLPSSNDHSTIRGNLTSQPTPSHEPTTVACLVRTRKCRKVFSLKLPAEILILFIFNSESSTNTLRLFLRYYSPLICNFKHSHARTKEDPGYRIELKTEAREEGLGDEDK